MNSNSMGAMPRSVGPALQRYAEDWAREGVEVWPKWFDILEATADSAARFLGAPTGQTILNQNVAYFQAAVASSLDLPEAPRQGRRRGPAVPQRALRVGPLPRARRRPPPSSRPTTA
jgi:kynureninase